MSDIRDWRKYSQLEGAEPIKLIHTLPNIHDKTLTSRYDGHYFYQDIWAFKKIYESQSKYHVDIGSRVDFVGFLTAITKVTFIDIRPLLAKLDNLDSKKGSILSIPYGDNSISSLSCLNVA